MRDNIRATCRTCPITDLEASPTEFLIQLVWAGLKNFISSKFQVMGLLCRDHTLNTTVIKQRLANLFRKGQGVHILGFVGLAGSVTTTQLSHCSHRKYVKE